MYLLADDDRSWSCLVVFASAAATYWTDDSRLGLDRWMSRDSTLYLAAQVVLIMFAG